MDTNQNGPKRENIGISSEKKLRVDLVTRIRGISLREASEEAWGDWLRKFEPGAAAAIPRVVGTRSRRPVAV